MLFQAIHRKIMKPILCGNLCMCICCAHAQGQVCVPKSEVYQILKCLLKRQDRTLYQRCVKSTHQCKLHFCWKNKINVCACTSYKSAHTHARARARTHTHTHTE